MYQSVVRLSHSHYKPHGYAVWHEKREENQASLNRTGRDYSFFSLIE